jgi:hypothetical protein
MKWTLKATKFKVKILNCWSMKRSKLKIKVNKDIELTE